MLGRPRWAFFAVCAVPLLAGTAAGTDQKLDLALVIAVDVSSSMTIAEQEFQRVGFVEAFRSPAVHKAIQKGALGRIAVAYVEWSGADHQVVLVPWTVIDHPDAALSFARRLAQAPIRQAGFTSISGAIEFGMGLLADLGDEPARRVIDISGDGPNNDGGKVTRARDAALATGVTINGLPITIGEPGRSWDMVDLEDYYRDCVIGGPGSFMLSVSNADQLPAVISAKIIREIAGTGGDASLRVPAQVTADCLAGEKRRRAEEAIGGEGGP